MISTEAIVSLFRYPRDFLYGGDEVICVAGDSGTILSVRLAEQQEGRLMTRTGYRKQAKIFPAGENIILWSFYEEWDNGAHFKKVDAILDVNHHKTVIASRDGLQDVLALGYKGLICSFIDSVKVYENKRNSWSIVQARSKRVSHMALIDESLLAVVLTENAWLEIWDLSEQMQTIAAFRLPERVTSLASRAYDLLLGTSSGNLYSLRIYIKNH